MVSYSKLELLSEDEEMALSVDEVVHFHGSVKSWPKEFLSFKSATITLRYGSYKDGGKRMRVLCNRSEHPKLSG